MNSIEVDAKDMEPPSWISEIEPFCIAVLRSLDIKNWELSVLLCGDSAIRELNNTYRHIDESTDVLSFSQLEDDFGPQPDENGSVYAGDIVISLDTLKFHSAQFKVDEEEELKRLIIHGILHLSGYDHQSNGPEEPMLQLQEQMVTSFSGVKLF
jgi:probable rRNA maturation factor